MLGVPSLFVSLRFFFRASGPRKEQFNVCDQTHGEAIALVQFVEFDEVCAVHLADAMLGQQHRSAHDAVLDRRRRKILDAARSVHVGRKFNDEAGHVSVFDGGIVDVRSFWKIVEPLCKTWNKSIAFG